MVNDPLYLHTSDKALMNFQSVLARPGGVTLQPLLFVVNDPMYLHTSDKALMIFQSVLARPGGVTATLVCCERPSVFTYVPSFSVYAAPGKITSAMAAPLSPW